MEEIESDSRLTGWIQAKTRRTVNDVFRLAQQLPEDRSDAKQRQHKLLCTYMQKCEMDSQWTN